ncbi:hypothetical protein ASZ78_008555 [Callipepla squamata]|uniref:Phosphatidylinositol 4,5-bisphosphate 5-phosphatase A n=1 Tax=Callipepla squamata TaxID=9009 RepID=A0A226NE92_CALSU|nr:hypothetical protein ASZ78_008555 [Callipepla squamata]
MERGRRGSAEQGPAALGSRPVSPRSPSPAVAPPALLVPFGSEGPAPPPPPPPHAARRSSRPDAAFEPFSPRPPSEGAQPGCGRPDERLAGRSAQLPALDVGRARPDPLSVPAPLPVVPGVPSGRGPVLGAELGPAEPDVPGKPLPKAESSDHISAWAAPRAVGLPKAVSSEFLSAGRVGLGKAVVLAKPEPEELPLFGSITVVTWNVGTAMPPNDVTSLLHLNTGETNDADMIAIGLQEVNSKINKRLKDALFTDQWSELFMDVLSPFHFVLVSTVRMQGVILLVFAKYYHLPFLQDIQTDCTRTGLGGYWGNKGGVSVRLSIFGHMVCFLNCHLPAHLEKAEQRKEDFATILHMQQFEGRAASGILDHDLVFWFGDLNFRIESLDIRFVKYAIDSNILSQLWEKDQLNIAKSTWPVLSGFQEGPLNFPPTFKFDVGTNKYDSSAKKRKPAWTDRILWKIKSPSSGASGRRPSRGVLSVSQLCYCSHMEYTVSDHKPVAAVFAVQFASKADKPPVEIFVADEWIRPEQAVVKYKMAAGFHRSSWDWIGLYRVGFRHPKDYVSYVWARSDDGERCVEKQLCAQVMFSEEGLPKGKGEYILGYYSNTFSSIVGVTEPFQISLPRSEEGSSPTDSSGSSSEEEDDSTLVLLAPKSRSPSPGKMKRHRSRSPSLAKFQGLILRPSSRDRGTSRSPSPQSRRGLTGDIPAIHLPQLELGRRGSKAKESGQVANSQDSSPGSFYQTVREPCIARRAAADNPLARADPRNLGLLPALRLETIDQAMGRRRESADQGYPCRRMSPTSPPCSTSPKEGGSPRELDGYSCTMGR